MGNNPSRPGGLQSRPRYSSDRAYTKRAYTTRARRGKYDRDGYDDEDDFEDYLPQQPYGAPFPPQQGYYVHPQYGPAQHLVFPQPQIQTGLNPVVPGMPMTGAIPTAGNPFPAPPMNMPVPEPAMPGAGPDFGAPQNVHAPVIPPMPSSRRGRAATPYAPPNQQPWDSPSEDEYGDELTAEARERLQPPLAPGQYGPFDRARDRTRTPAPVLRRPRHGGGGDGYGHRRAASSPSPGYMREESPPFGDHPPVIPPPPPGTMPFGSFSGPSLGQASMFVQQPGIPMPMPESMQMRMPEPEMPGGPERMPDRRPFVPHRPRPNPLPPPPRDILQSSPYARLLDELRKPIDEHALKAKIIGAPAIHTVGAVNIAPPAPGVVPQGHGHGTRSSGKEKKKRGLFRSLSHRLAPRRSEDELDARPAAAGPAPVFIGGTSTAVYPIVQHMPDGSTTLIYNPPGAPGGGGMPMAGAGSMGVPPPGYVPNASAAAAPFNVGAGPPPALSPAPVVIPPGIVVPPGQDANGMRMPTPQPARTPSPMPPPPPPHIPPVVKITRGGELEGLLHVSPDKVYYGHRSYPTGAHLLEALKFLPHRGDLAERVRGCGTSEEAGALAAGLREHWRGDWEERMVEMMEEVLYTKLMHYPTLRTLLMHTGSADLVFSDPDTTWGDGEIGQGLNWLGVALMNVRTRLRDEGVDS